MLGREQAPLADLAAGLERDCPELLPEFVGPEELSQLEPSLAPGLSACRIETGHPVRPAAATLAMAERARRAGAVIHEGLGAERVFAGGVLAGGERRAADAVLVAAGPWTPALIDPGGEWRPIVAVWGVVADVRLEDPPVHVLEEAGVKAVAAGEPGSVFSLITAEGLSGVGSSFEFEEPDHAAVGPGLRDAGAAFVPALREAPVVSTRACARPQSRDGRPLIGPVEGVEGVHVAAGHGAVGHVARSGVGPPGRARAAGPRRGAGDAQRATLRRSRNVQRSSRGRMRWASGSTSSAAMRRCASGTAGTCPSATTSRRTCATSTTATAPRWSGRTGRATSGASTSASSRTCRARSPTSSRRTAWSERTAWRRCCRRCPRPRRCSSAPTSAAGSCSRCPSSTATRASSTG